MIRIELSYLDSGDIQAIRAEGHADYAETGYDIVCSAVTALMAAGITGLTDVLGLAPNYCLAEGLIELELEASDWSSKEAQIILKTLHLGLKQLLGNYGDYIELID